jgi:non-ribosomal peptide synthetase component F
MFLLAENLMLSSGDALDRIRSARSLVEVFETCVALYPEAAAVAFEGRVLSYRELNDWANRLARLLLAKGASDSSLVAIMINRSSETIVAIVAVLKSGAAFLPLDPATPSERLVHVLRAGAPRIVVTTGDNIRHRLASLSAGLTHVSPTADELRSQDGTDFGTPISRNSRAYVMFTFGSTGQPKGVEVTHANVLRLFGVLACLRISLL